MAGFFDTSQLAIEDYIYAAVLALFFTWLITNITKLFNAVTKRPTEFGFQTRDITKIMQKCYALFPNETVQFQGETFKRGMNIRVTTINKKTFEGELIGQNDENIFCVLTKSFIAADIIDNVTEMIAVSIKTE